MGIIEIFNKANYYSQSNKEQGWSLEITKEIAKSNPHIITPELAQEIKTTLAPKEALQNPIKLYDTKKIELENIMDTVINTKQETYGRSM